MKRRELILGSGAAAAAIMSARLPVSARVMGSNIDPLTPPAKGPITVGVVVGKNATVIDFAAPWEVFQDVYVASRGTTEDDHSPFRLSMISDKDDVIEGTAGMLIKPHFTFANLAAFPNVVVIGAQGEHTPDKIKWIREASKHADIVMSVCTGAFLLAKTGLLDGLRATTHHDFYDSFAKQFPKIELVRGPRFIDNGSLAAAGGLTSSFELALHVVERYFGNTAATRTARYMEYNRSSARPEPEN